MAVKKFRAVVMGASAGGLAVLTAILRSLPKDFPAPVIIVQHRSKDGGTTLEEVLVSKCGIRIKQADEKEVIQPGTVYFAPADYHLLIENDGSFSLSYDPPVNFSRPSIDVLFESAAEVYKQALLAIILTGASNDGTAGIVKVAAMGGTTVAQDPKEAINPFMPNAAIASGQVAHVFPIREIIRYLLAIKQN